MIIFKMKTMFHKDSTKYDTNSTLVQSTNQSIHKFFAISFHNNVKYDYKFFGKINKIVL